MCHAELMKVNPGRDDAYEGLLEKSLASTYENPMIITHRIDENGKKVAVDSGLKKYLDNPMRLERFIGVIYRPATERWSHYTKCSLASQVRVFWFATIFPRMLTSRCTSSTPCVISGSLMAFVHWTKLPTSRMPPRTSRRLSHSRCRNIVYLPCTKRIVHFHVIYLAHLLDVNICEEL